MKNIRINQDVFNSFSLGNSNNTAKWSEGLYNWQAFWHVSQFSL